MKYTEIISALESATGPERRFDTAIGRAVGYQQFDNPGRGPSVLWTHPISGIAGKLPWFTSSVDGAKELGDALFPGHTAACVKNENGRCSASVYSEGSGMRTAEGHNIAIALCLAVLQLANQ